jgi:hypothetical protein
MITDAKKILEIKDAAGEIVDGLFAFVNQGDHMIEMTQYSNYDNDYYVVEVYDYLKVDEDDSANLFNASEIGSHYVSSQLKSRNITKEKNNGLLLCYELKSAVACETIEEAYEHYALELRRLHLF